MVFTEKIKSISSEMRVLEIGPGATPHPRSDVFLEKKFKNKESYFQQFGEKGPLITDKPIFYYDGKSFPFEDKEFDYIICSQVLEHVADIDTFLSEVFRVGRMGYFEYPTIYYEYLYNFDVHLSLIKYDNSILYWGLKSDFNFGYGSINEVLRQSLRLGNNQINRSCKMIFFQGFEWFEPFKVIKVKNIDDLFFEEKSVFNLINPPVDNIYKLSTKKFLISKIIYYKNKFFK